MEEGIPGQDVVQYIGRFRKVVRVRLEEGAVVLKEQEGMSRGPLEGRWEKQVMRDGGGRRVSGSKFITDPPVMAVLA